LRIGINCLSIKPKYIGGVTTFTFGIIDGLIKLNNQNRYQIYVNQNNIKLFVKYINEKNVELILCKKYNLIRKVISNISLLIFPVRFFKIINNQLYNKLEKLMDSKSDLIYTPTATLMSYGNKIPTIVSMHDIQHFHFPQYFDRITLNHRRKNYFFTAKSASYLQASSNYIKNDFLHHYPFLNPENIFMINEGVKVSDFKIKKTEAIENSIYYNLPKEFIFYPAQLWHHKDHITVLKAISILKDKYNLIIPLVLTGGKFSASKIIFNFIKNNDLDDQVFYLGKVPFKHLVSLYKLSKYFITATLYESSSLPVLEAAACGTAIIASNTPPNQELSCYLDMTLFEAKNEDSLAEKILHIWKNRDLREKQIQKNLNNIEMFSWDNIAEKCNDYFYKMIDSSKPN